MERDDKENFDEGNDQKPPYKDFLDVMIITLVVFVMMIELFTKLENSKDIEANNYFAYLSLLITSLPCILKVARKFLYCMEEHSLAQVKKLLTNCEQLLSANISSLSVIPEQGWLRIHNPRYRLELDSLIGTAMTFELQYSEEPEQLLEDGDSPGEKKKKKLEEEEYLMEPSTSSEFQSSEAEELKDAASWEEPMPVAAATFTFRLESPAESRDDQIASSCDSLSTSQSDLPLTSDDPTSKTRFQPGTSELIEESIDIDFPSITTSESSTGKAADQPKEPTPEETADQPKEPTPEETADQPKKPTPEETADQPKKPTPEETADQHKEPTPEEAGEQRKKKTEETTDQYKKPLSPQGKQKKSKVRMSPKKLGQALTSATVRFVKKTASTYRQLRSSESRRSSPKAGTSTGKSTETDSETELAGEENLALEGGSSDGESTTTSAEPEFFMAVGGEGSGVKHKRPSKRDLGISSPKTKRVVPSQPGPSGTQLTQPVVRIQPPTPVGPRRSTRTRASSISTTLLSPPQVVTRQSRSESAGPETRSMHKNRRSRKESVTKQVEK